MCGIAGIIGSPDLEAAHRTAAQMAQKMAHRGPDAQGVTNLPGAVLAHRRLAIIDLDHAADQPFADPESGTAIVFNGEIYNFPELRQELAAQGRSFRTHSDTEVILALYLQGGAAALDALDGMFALAIFDPRTQETVLMRDRFGKKPLYYFQHESELIFASELGALAAHPAFPHTLREEAIADFLAYEYVPGPETVYRNVWQLPAAHQAVFKRGKWTMRRYWQLDYTHKLNLSFPDAARRLRETLERAAAKRLIADVPCGLFLSGGVDSGIVSFLAARHAEAPLSAFTIGFEESRFDERELARTSAAWINRHTAHGVKHSEKVVNHIPFDALADLMRHFGEPFADFSLLPTWFLSQFAAQKVKFVLSGDGADELFGGYERYRAMALCRRLERIVPAAVLRLAASCAKGLPDGGKRSRTGRLARFLHLAATPSGERYFALMAQSSQAECRQLYGERLQSMVAHDAGTWLRRIQDVCRAPDPVERCAECDTQSYLAGDILVKVDRMAMANSLEVRSPFLDREVAELAAALPFAFHQQGKERKRLLRAACADCLAPEVSSGRKKGFALPAGDWFRTAWKADLETHLLEGRLVQDGWMQQAALAAVMAKHNTGRCDRTELLASLLALELFLEGSGASI